VITVTFPDNFVPERTYILDVFLGEFLGLEYRLKPDSGARDYRMQLANGSRLIIEDCFFGKHDEETGYCFETNVPSAATTVRNRFTGGSDLPVIYGRDGVDVSPDAVRCYFDVFASAFFMLTRWEERAIAVRDEHGRFPASSGLASRSGFLDRPIVDEYADVLWSMLAHLGLDQARAKRPFRLILTHDVDHIRLWKGSLGFLRSFAGDLAKRKSPGLATANLKHYALSRVGRAEDPYDTFDFLMDTAESRGMRAEFYFMGGGVTAFDDLCSLSNGSVRSLLRKTNTRGHLIGFHPSYNSFNEPNQWKQEYDLLKGASPQPVTHGRQHYLRFEVPTTWQIWEDNGMAVDSTLAYTEREGFRCGTCREYPVFNIVSRKELKLRERPLTAMDGTFVQYQKLDPQETESRIMRLLDTVKRYGGDFVVLWHNSNFHLPPWHRYRGIYERVLDAGRRP
jgi:hypothetical protein